MEPDLALVQRYILDNSVASDTGCLIWARAKSRIGYGYTSVYRDRAKYAHRLSYIAFKGPIAHGMKVLHSCDVRDCVNPEHLREGTQLENVQDMMSRGRHVLNHKTRGDKNPQAKLTYRAASQIRELHQSGVSLAALGRQYGVSNTAIYYVIKGVTWNA